MLNPFNDGIKLAVKQKSMA